MSKNLKIALGIGIAAAAVTIITIGVVRRLKEIKSLTMDAEELPEDLNLELDEPVDEDAAE